MTDLVEQLETMEKDDIPYTLQTWESKVSEPVPHAKIRLIGPCSRSQFGDEHLYFRHQRWEEDVELRPEFANGESETQARGDSAADDDDDDAEAEAEADAKAGGKGDAKGEADATTDVKAGAKGDATADDAKTGGKVDDAEVDN